jgi:hypothetical protein
MKKTIFAAGLAGLSLLVLAAPSSAATWRATHPRRTEVNARLANQDRRIHQERKEGDITTAQAQDLHQEDRGIRADERFDASQNNGHITKAEQHNLNQQENAVSQQIGR